MARQAALGVALGAVLFASWVIAAPFDSARPSGRTPSLTAGRAALFDLSHTPDGLGTLAGFEQRMTGAQMTWMPAEFR